MFYILKFLQSKFTYLENGNKYKKKGTIFRVRGVNYVYKCCFSQNKS